MHVRVIVEWGNDALDGETVMSAQSWAFDAVSQAIGHGLEQGGTQVPVPGSPFPVDVRFRRELVGPQVAPQPNAGVN